MRFLIVTLILLAVGAWAEASNSYVCKYTKKTSHHKSSCTAKCQTAYYNMCLEKCSKLADAKAQDQDADADSDEYHAPRGYRYRYPQLQGLRPPRPRGGPTVGLGMV